MMRRGPRMASGKVRRRGLCYLSSVRLVVLFFFILKRNPEKYAKDGVNKQIEYTKKLMKENPH